MTSTTERQAAQTGRPAGPGLAMRGSGRWVRTLPLLGPAFVAAVAYGDPGNFATNFSSGASFGYRLLWVIVAANLMAMLIQSLTAKLGVATGQDLATLCRQHFRRPVVWGLWVQAEAVAIATDIAEIVGGAVALNLLFGVPLPVGGAITAVVAFALLAAQGRGYRPFELIIAGLLSIIALGFAYTLFFAGIDPVAVTGGLVPGFAGTESVVLATGILGATVMPHVIYVHSALTPKRYFLPDGFHLDADTAPTEPSASDPAVGRVASHGCCGSGQRGDADHRRAAVLQTPASRPARWKRCTPGWRRWTAAVLRWRSPWLCSPPGWRLRR